MTRTEAIELIRAKLDTLPDDRIGAIAEIAIACDRPTVYSTLSDAEKVDIDAALDELDRGESIPGQQVLSDMRQHIAEGLAQADRGEFASDEEVAAAFARFRS